MWQNVSISPNLETWILRMHWISVLMEKISTMFLVSLLWNAISHGTATTCTTLHRIAVLFFPGSWQMSLTQCCNTCGFFRDLCHLNKGIMRRWLHGFCFCLFLTFQTQWDVTLNVSCRDGGFILRSRHVAGMWCRCTTESYTHTSIGRWEYVLKHSPCA